MSALFEIVVALSAFAVFGVAGAHRLLEGEDDATKLLWSPVLGAAILSLLVTNGSAIGMAAGSAVWAIGALGVATAGWTVFRRRWSVDWRDAGIVLAIGAVGVAVVGWAGLVTGSGNYLALSSSQAVEMNLLADHLRLHSLRDAVIPDGSRPALLSTAYTLATGGAMGGEAVLAWFSALWRLPARDVSFSLLTALYALTALSNYIFVRQGLLWPVPAARLAAAFGACGAVGALAYFRQDAAVLLAMAIVPLAATAIMRLLRRPSTETIILAAVLLGAGIGVMPALLWWLPLTVLVLAQVERRADLWRPLGLVAAGACATNLRHVMHSITALFSNFTPPNEDMAFLAMPWAWPVSAGLVPAIHMTRDYLGIPSPVWVSTGILLFTYMAYLVWRIWQLEPLRPLGILVAALGLTTVLLLLRDSTRELGFGTLTAGMGLLFALLSVRVWSRDGVLTVNPWAKLGTGLLLAMQLVTTVWCGQQTLAGDEYKSLEVALSRVPADQKLLVEAEPGGEQAWLLYAARERAASVRVPSARLSYWARHFGISIKPSKSETLVIRGRAPEALTETDIVNLQQRQKAVWTLATLELSGSQNFGKIGSGWHGREGSKESPFRWLAKDGEFSISQPTKPGIRLSFDVVPGPGIANPVRTIELYGGATLILQQKINGPTRLVSPPIRSEEGVMPFRIHVVEDAGPIASDVRILNVQIRDIRVEPAARPDAVTAQAPAVPKDEGIHGDGWASPQVLARVRRTAGASSVTISGLVPEFAKYRYPQTIKVKINGKGGGIISVKKAGDFSQDFPLGATVGAVDVIALDSSFFFQPSLFVNSPDTRKLSFMKLKILTH